jgi:signal transduction histidine kinase
MPVTDARSKFLLNGPRIGLGWVVVLIAVIAVSAFVERQKLLAELLAEADVLHRVASQRADQHDAHLTSLSALAVAGSEDRQDLMLEVAATILRFYPTIRAVNLVELEKSAGFISTRSDLPGETVEAIREAAKASDGQLVLRQSKEDTGAYLLVKRSPNSDAARFGLALQINADALIDSGSGLWQRPSVARALLLPDGTALSGAGPLTSPQFEKILGSTSQQLIFQAGIAPGISDLLPPVQVFFAIIIASLLYLAAILGFRQLTRARKAETQARLSAQEARLAHASRVNAMGEMASGIAHELTQPLTAILSQAQAGRHLAKGGNIDAVGAVLEGVAAQAKRASAILDRLRNWTRPSQSRSDVVSLNEAVDNVLLLLGPEATRAGIDLQRDPATNTLLVTADPVELEQIVFNLVRNAMEAVAGADLRRVTISTRADGPEAILEVADTGPGVASDVRARLFEPFVTGKPGGTGLGLALCQRLAERIGGELLLDESGAPTVFRMRVPLTNQSAQRAAE